MNKYFYWLIVYDPNIGYCGSNICVSSPKQIHDFVISHLRNLPCTNDGYVLYGYERTMILPDDYIRMPFREDATVVSRSFYCIDLHTLIRKKVTYEKTI